MRSKLIDEQLIMQQIARNRVQNTVPLFSPAKEEKDYNTEVQQKKKNNPRIDFDFLLKH